MLDAVGGSGRAEQLVAAQDLGQHRDLAPAQEGAERVAIIVGVACVEGRWCYEPGRAEEHGAGKESYSPK